jgi:hypothetical protein
VVHAHYENLIIGRRRWLTPIVRLLAAPTGVVRVYEQGRSYEKRDRYTIWTVVQRIRGTPWAKSCDKVPSASEKEAIQKLFDRAIYEERWNTGQRRVRRFVPKRRLTQSVKRKQLER